jgi:hypothetical protein
MSDSFGILNSVRRLTQTGAVEDLVDRHREEMRGDEERSGRREAAWEQRGRENMLSVVINAIRLVTTAETRK